MTEKKIKPISPKETAEEKLEVIPPEVIEAFNSLIDPVYGGIVTQEAVVTLLVEKGIKRSDIFKHHWLDIEDIFGEAGWKVEYDKPGGDERYEAFFTFKPKKRKSRRE